MSLLLTMGVILTVAAFGRVMVLYLDSRAKYLNRLRPTPHTQVSRSTTRLFTGSNDRRVTSRAIPAAPGHGPFAIRSPIPMEHSCCE